MPAVSVLIKPASGLCNMKCEYCFYCDESSKREIYEYGLMTLPTLENVIKKTLEQAEGYYSLAFQGGEPTLCGIDFFENAVRFVEKYNKRKVQIQYSLQTNGYAIDENWASFFKKSNFLVGISVDGTEEIHNKYRRSADGKATYARVMENIAILEKYGVDYNILTVVHKEVAENIDEIYKEYKLKGFRYLQFITCLDPIGEEHGKMGYSLNPKLYGDFLCRLFSLWMKDYRKGKQPYIRQFYNYVGIMLGKQPEVCEQRGVCGIQYVVESNGNVYPCDFYVLDEYYLGNLNEDTFADINKKREQIGFLVRSNRVSEECINCKWKNLCRCGCYRSRVDCVSHDGTIVENGINYFCQGYKQFFSQNEENIKRIAGYFKPAK